MKQRILWAAALALGVTAVTSSELRAACPGGTVVISSDITTNTTWSADNEYCISGVRFVRSGATLLIEPGTVVRGNPDEKKCFLAQTPCNTVVDCLTPGDACVNDPGTLVITRGSKLFAQGTALKPIVFTNIDDDNLFANSEPNPGGDYADKANALAHEGEWGGLILLGRGYVANNALAGPNPAREVQIEGLQARGICSDSVTRCVVDADCGAATPCNTRLGFYGNCSASPLSIAQCDDDDSGSVSYLSIRYGGFNLAANNEINGLTLGGVGRATDLSFIEVFQNQDDGIEMFGGAVNMSNIAVVSPGDDSIDYDEGWRGKVQFAFVLQGAAGGEKSDKAGEWDGGNAPDGSQPRTTPTIYNATMVGLGGLGAVSLPDLNDPANAFTNQAFNSALLYRDNAGGRLYNSALLNFGGSTVMIEGASPASANTSAQRTGTDYVPGTGNCSVTTGQACGTALPACPGGETCVLHYREADSASELDVRDNLFWCFGGGSTIPVTGAQAIAAGANDNVAHYDAGVFTNATFGNTYQNCAAALPIRRLVRGLGTVGNPDPVDSIDPRPASGSSLLSSTRTAPADGFFEPVRYKGAFRGSNWADGWSNLSRLGYFPTCSGTTTGATPAEASGFGFNTAGSKTTLSWGAVPAPGLMGVVLYDVLRTQGTTSAAAASFATATCIETNDGDSSATDAALPAVSEAFFYLVRAGNACGEGTLGFRSDGTERTGTTCP